MMTVCEVCHLDLDEGESHWTAHEPANIPGMSALDVLELNDYEVALAWVRWHASGDWFTSDLLRAMRHADDTNFVRFHAGFPHEWEVMFWYKTGRRPSI